MALAVKLLPQFESKMQNNYEIDAAAKQVLLHEQTSTGLPCRSLFLKHNEAFSLLCHRFNFGFIHDSLVTLVGKYGNDTKIQRGGLVMQEKTSI